MVSMVRTDVHNNIPSLGYWVLDDNVGSNANFWRWAGMLVIILLHLTLVFLGLHLSFM